MKRASDVVVGGGGAIGACVAYELAREGVPVAVLEREAAVAGGCSGGNAGLLCPSHATPLATPNALRQAGRWIFRRDSPFYLKPRLGLIPWLARFAVACTPTRAKAATTLLRDLSRLSLALHGEFASAGLETGFQRRGTLNVYEAESGFEAGRQEAAESVRAGLVAEVLSGIRARELEPALASGLAGAIYYPGEAHCEPAQFVKAVAAAARECGAHIRTGVEVLAVRTSGAGAQIDTTDGALTTGMVVLATGAWTPVLARQLGVHVPIEGGKGYHVEVVEGAADPRVPIFIQEARVIATPLPGRLRLAGTLELTGLNLSVDMTRVNAIVRTAKRVLPELEPRVRHVWRGLRPCSPDGLPLIGPLDGGNKVVLATGHAMLGLTLAPVTGRLVAELVTGRQPSLDLEPLSPARFVSLGATRIASV